jgi:MFS family permease
VTADERTKSESAWAPFRHRTFAAMWAAQFVSNVGSWMQTVGAQWLMLTLTSSATLLGLIQTAATLPVLLFSVPAGVIGDLVDRRRFLLATQAVMLLAAAALGVLAAAGLVTPWLLLGLIFALGVGQAFTSPTWQALQPELVPSEDRQQAISLGAVNQNLARAVGPAIGGIVLAATSAAALFFLNAASFVAVIAVIVAWRGIQITRTLPREHVREATRAGARYVAASPALRAVLVRTLLFALFASPIWALLPLTARSQLRLGSGGYGLLLGCVGVGALGGAALLPQIRARLQAGTLVTLSSLTLGGTTIVLAYVHVDTIVGIALVIAGLAWILALSIFNSLYQLTLPGWVKTRGMGWYLIAFQGGMAIGSAAFGILAEQIGISRAFSIAAAGLILGPIAGMHYKFQTIAPEELLPAGDWPQPHLTTDASPVGPVLVTVEYWPRTGLESEFLDEIRDLRPSRRRTGASSWKIWRDAENPQRFIEEFVVASWQEHLRQHERVSKRDQERLNRIRAMTDPDHPTVVTHLLAPNP